MRPCPVHRLIAIACVALLSYGCGGGDDVDPTSPEDLNGAKPPRTLTIGTGAGNGSGTIVLDEVGEVAGMVCTVEGGTGEPCMRHYPWKSTVTLTVKPAQGSRFTGWSGGCTGTAPSCKLTMTDSRDVTASFSGPGTLSYMLNVVGAGTGNGTIASQDSLEPPIACTITAGTATSGSPGACSGSYLEGTAITLSPVAAAGHSFVGWAGACSGTGNCVVTLLDNQNVTAEFIAPPGPEATVGRWDAPSGMPIVGVHLTQLMNGTFLVFGHDGEPQTWRPGGGFTEVPNATCSNPATCEVFCAGHTFLTDGRLLVAGGHNEALGDGNGIKQSSIFDGTGWTATGPMKYSRWYPTLVTLEDGDVVALGGSSDPNLHVSIPERFSGSTWRPLTTASRVMPYYPRAFLEPKNGWIFYAGDHVSRYLIPSGTGTWTASGLGNNGNHATTYRNYGSAVMIDSKVLYAGGGTTCPTLPEKRAEYIDLSAAAPTWRLTGSMAFRRRQTNLTILPDGKVLVTGGTSACGFTDPSGAVFAAEAFDFSTGKWTRWANASVVRVYHATTALLPDGRVLAMGSGEGAGVTSQLNYEIFSPPYLFKGTRPTYNLASTNMAYGQPFTVATPNAASIRKVTIVRHNSTTHAFDMGQRLNTLGFQVAPDGQSLTVTAPASGRIAPPGPYMLFIVSQNGVPSVAQTILVSP